MSQAEKPRVVIVGGGFGGLEAARALARAECQITLIDQRNYHLFQPLLYQVATAALSPSEIAWPLRHVLTQQANVRVVMTGAAGVDLDARSVTTEAGTFAYDHLIIATGATHSYFGKPQWESAAPGLKSLEDATELRRRVLSAFERAETAAPEQRAALLTFVVVGGGATGVEMAGAVAELARDALSRDFRQIDPGQARVLLVEGGPRVLPALSPDLSAYAEDALEDLGVEVRTSAMVTDLDTHGVDLGDTRVEAATIIWAAGVAASPLAAGLAVEHDRAGRVKVAPDLSVPGHPEVFVVGDAAAMASNGKPVPGIAPAAKQAGKHAARQIAERLAGRPGQAPFRYAHAGDLATIGRHAAAVQIGQVKLTGFVGWVFWGLAHVYFLIGLRNRIAVAFDWAWSWLTRQRNIRLIVQHRGR
ncbi:NAD(P)/FAD-dependent oxidoreductase [Phenylobacterium sp. NIBR 498073]|uniref:NAD(P)/FAD-dependent oxidoreductase n=1 Tax=Phenylobacterium sp. NIBR 498073 TaxID=3015177 RepID=UPI0022B33BD3|nr:NAD(P)/FAD-dependent oxidoreductase [Phenylobacterium sp. NIBR 498073]WGU42041.1 NAD(P)/FAD-dependent oxidoreductase [Phenylobacterium sp. NIBR 498073]